MIKKTSHKKKHRIKREGTQNILRKDLYIPNSFSVPSVQCKPLCPCGGGCPRCQTTLPIQTKLMIRQPNDKYEQEADRVAEQVIRMPESTVHRKPDPNLHFEIGALGNGWPLCKSVRNFFEPRFGYDFSRARVHTGAAAAQMARALNAKALTIGPNIVFGAGQYDPGNSECSKLLAHELTHVVQQTEMSSIQKKEKLIQRMVRPGYVSCRNYPPSHPVMQAIGTTDPVKEIEVADARAIQLLDNVIDELEGTRSSILKGAVIGWPTISDATALALRNRFQIDPDSRRVWTATGAGTVDVLIKRFRAVRKILNGGWIRYTCLGDLTDCCDPGTWACASEGEYRIELCRPWWDSSSLDEQAGTLLHEGLHIYFGFIEDVGHLGNANCYEQFAYDINNVRIEDGCP